MADFATLAARMDAQVDARLGDIVFYKRDADPDFVELKAFLIPDAPLGDAAKTSWRLKIAKALRPALSKNDRLHSPLLEGIYRPIGGDFDTDGRYWITPIQKVS